jgi:hypothetical protein
MPVVADVRSYVGAATTDDPFIEKCIAQAQALIVEYAGDTDIPMVVMDSCVTQVASELFHRRQAPSGIAQFSTMDGSPMRVARDPLTSVYALLNRYVQSGV